MTRFVPLGATPLASDRLPDEQMYNNDGSFVRGARAGVYGMGSGLRNAVGAVADAFDYDNFAAQQYGEADRLAQKAGRVGPRISSLEQLSNEGYSLGNIGDYALGTMGSALPSMAVGLGATALTGGALLPSLAAGTLAYTPMEMGDAVAKWRQANPGQQIDGETAARLGLTGLASAGAQSPVPAAVGGKLAGRGLASAPVAGLKQAVGRNLAEIPMEGFTEGLGEGIKQFGATPDAPLDWGQIGENAVAGAIGGAPMAGVGALGDYAHGNRQAVVDTASRAAKAVGKALEPAAGAVEGAKTATKQGFGDAWTAMSDLGESAWKGASESDLGKTLSERVANTQQRVRTILDDPEVPAEWKAKVEAAAKTAGNKASAAMVWAVDGTRNKVKQVREEGLRKTALDTLRDSVDAVVNGDYLGNKADLANGTDRQISTRLRESATKAMGAAKTWGEDLLRRKDVDDATKAEVSDIMGNPDDPTGPQRVAAKWKLYDAKDKVVKGFQDIKARFQKGLDSASASASEDPNAPKKSEDYSGVRAVIGEALRPHMVKINEAVGKDPKALEEVADSLRTYIEVVTDAEGKKTDAVDRGFARMKLTQVLGDSAADVMADVAEAVGQGRTREQTERVFEELGELQALQRSHGDLVKMMTRALPEGQTNEVFKDIERVVHWATGADVRGKDVTQAEVKYRNQKMEADLQKRYGAKAQAIMTQVEQMLSPKQGGRYDPEADRLAAEEDKVDYETALREEGLQEESRFIGSGANRKGLFVDPKVHAKNYPEEAAQGKGIGNELKRDVIDEEFPNGNARFVSVAEDPTIFDRSPTETSAMTKKRKELEAELPGDENAPAREQALQAFREERVKKLTEEGRGMFRVDHSSHERLSVEEIDAMRMDTANFGDTDHPSRLAIKPEGSQRAAHVFDATRVTKEAMKRINREREWTKGDDIDQLTRMGRAFSDGVAALMREYGRIKVTPDLVIGTINGKPITALEALKADKRTIKDLRTDDQTMEAVDARKRLDQVRKELEGASKADRKDLEAEVKDLRGRLKYLENSREGRINTDLAAKTTEDIETALNTIKKRLVTENSATEREKLVKEMDFLTGRLDNLNERATYDKSFQDGARQDADPTGNIHEASARLSESELQVRQNVDGSTKTLPSTYVANAKPLVLVADRVRKAGGIGEVLANRLITLAKNFPAISEKDQQELLALQGASQPSAIGETVNRMARKYAGQIVAPKVVPPKASPPAQKSDVQEEGTPDPKAVAAKKAAFLERAASGDKALIKELQASTDLKGLQRAVAALNEAGTAPEVVQVINDRIHELVKDEGQAYHAQTRKYSLEGTNDGTQRLVTRLADARRGAFAHADEKGVFRSQAEDVRFGPVEQTTRYFLLDGDGTHAFVIPRQFVRSVEATLAKYPADRHADVLAAFALQHALYDPKTTMFESFGPNPKAPAGDLLVSLDALKDTGERFTGGIPVTAVEGVSSRQLVDFLADALAYSKAALQKDDLTINWERMTGANKGKRGGGVFSHDKVDPLQTDGRSEPLSAKAIRDHLFKVLGDTVQLEFANLMYAGDFTRQDGEDIIRISVHALNPTTVAYHESLHAFFQQLKDKGLPDVVQAVFKGLNTPHVMRQLRERLKDSPEALAQLSDPEERAAYAFQFWASDPTFSLKPETRTVFEKIAAAIRKVLGVWSNDERALEIFKYFHSGKYQQQTASKLAIHTATMRAGRNSTVDTVAHMIKPLKKLGDAVVGAGGERLRDSGIPALRELADLIKLRGTDEGRDGGFIPAARLARTEHMNWLATHLQEYGADALNEALEAMQAGRKASTTQAKIVQKLVQEKFLRQTMFDKYLPDAGVVLGDLGPDYFPRVWDPAYISKNQEAFTEMLESYGVKNADAVVQKIVSGNGTEWGFDDNAQIEIERPGFVNTRERKLAFISGEDALPFLQKDFWKTMDNYVTQATRRGEWSRRFGYKNEKFDGLLGRAVRQGATPEQVETAKDFAKAVDGTLGDDIDPSYRRLMGNMVVYQNLRLLPLAIFSSLVDPLGVVVRGGTVRDGWDTFKRGIKELRKSWQKEPKFDADTMLAEEIGTIEDAMLQHTISSMYGQGLMGDGAQKINDLFFRYNFMEGFNRSMRVGATRAALGFVGRHAKGANEHSTRYLAELGLEAGEVQFDADGKVVVDERVKLAVNRWVDGAVLRPNAAETPIWMHDPHYALFAHLKQFAFAFHHTFLKRVWHEYQHGNYKPIMALASFVPMMMAADFVKDMLANGGDEPEWKRQWTFMDHVGYGVERAGILGVSQFALDGLGDMKNGGTGIGALTGPTVDQLLDAVSMIGGRREFSSFALRSMPANSLYRGYVGPADEMEFEGDSMN